MSDREKPDPQEPHEQEIEREIRRRRKFSLGEAIGRAGQSHLRGGSSTPRLIQTQWEAEQWIKSNINDPAGALTRSLIRRVHNAESILDRHLDEPLAAVRDIIQWILKSEARLRDFTREVDVEWGRMYDERPRFERPGRPPHPDDPYTMKKVEQRLNHLLGRLENDLT